MPLFEGSSEEPLHVEDEARKSGGLGDNKIGKSEGESARASTVS